MLTLQIGQCGNQLGQALFNKLDREEDPNNASIFFRRHSDGTKLARAVLVDTEPKVIQKSLSHDTRATWRYDYSNTLVQQGGSGNNWAMGYEVHGPKMKSASMDLVRKEMERTDRVSGFLALQSVAGGTGSGLGSYLTKELAEEFPRIPLLNAVVWPHATGEVIVQNYNAVLTMASLVKAANGIVILQNDHAYEICKRLLRVKRPSFEHMNQVLATHLSSVLLPSSCEDLFGRLRREDPISTIAQHLCHHPGFKLLDIKTVPLMPEQSKEYSTHSWSGILKHLHQMQVTDAAYEGAVNWEVSRQTSVGRPMNKSIANVLYLRGRDGKSADVGAFEEPSMYVPWNVDPLKRCLSSSTFSNYDKSATLLSNSKAAMSTLTTATDKAYEMYSSGAYVHQYARHGVDGGFFQQSFLRVDQVVQSYRSL